MKLMKLMKSNTTLYRIWSLLNDEMQQVLIVEDSPEEPGISLRWQFISVPEYAADRVLLERQDGGAQQIRHDHLEPIDPNLDELGDERSALDVKCLLAIDSLALYAEGLPSDEEDFWAELG